MNFTIKSRFFLVGPEETIGFKSLKKLNKYCNNELPAYEDLHENYHALEVWVTSNGVLETNDLLWYETDITGEWRYVADMLV